LKSSSKYENYIKKSKQISHLKDLLIFQKKKKKNGYMLVKMHIGEDQKK